MIGRYLDKLNDEARDRVLMAQEWCVNGFGDHLDGPHCLAGHVEKWGEESQAEYHRMRPLREECGTGYFLPSLAIPHRFDALAARVGLDRAVQLVKARAGLRTRVEVGTNDALQEVGR